MSLLDHHNSRKAHNEKIAKNVAPGWPNQDTTPYASWEVLVINVYTDNSIK
jgi:hypothetical protein